MLNDIATIELQGANFRTVQRLPILSQNGAPVKASLIYGRNGSGKSTIAKAFKRLKGELSSPIQSVSVFDTHNVTLTLTAEEQAHVFIFDEDFVNENVRVQEDGLGSIVMLGEKAGLTYLIQVATKELQVAETEKEQKKVVVDEFNNSASEKSPLYFIEKMKFVLKGDDNWAGRDKRIKGNAVNSSVSDNTYENISIYDCINRKGLREDIIEAAKNASLDIVLPPLPGRKKNRKEFSVVVKDWADTIDGEEMTIGRYIVSLPDGRKIFDSQDLINSFREYYKLNG